MSCRIFLADPVARAFSAHCFRCRSDGSRPLQRSHEGAPGPRLHPRSAPCRERLWMRSRKEVTRIAAGATARRELARDEPVILRRNAIAQSIKRRLETAHRLGKYPVTSFSRELSLEAGDEAETEGARGLALRGAKWRPAHRPFAFRNFTGGRLRQITSAGGASPSWRSQRNPVLRAPARAGAR
jgi:hypothetical protein